MNLQIVTNFFKKYKAVALYISIFLGFFLLSGESLFAVTQPTGLSDEDKGAVVEKINLLITGAAALMGMVTSFITMFLYPGWTNGTLFGLQDYLKEIWILISNVVYFIFAFILIAIAFMNIIGKGEGTWELKQAMPKFIIGVLIVPFSWFFVQFLLSISAILTVGILTLPYDSFSDHELFVKALDNTELAGEEICKDVIISLNGDFGDNNTDSLNSDEGNLDENIQCLEGGKVTIKELITGIDENGEPSSDAAGLQNSIFGVISIYSYGILRIQDLDTITGRDLETIETLVDLIFKILFDVLFVIVYLLLMIALLLALFIRGVRLWIYMMLSPVFGLFYFFGKGEVESDGAKFGVKEFIHLALIPVYVSGALAFGLVFIMVASEGVKEVNDGEDVLKAGGFSLTILGAHGSGESEKSVIGKLIIEIFGIAILWISVMFALSKSETTKNIIKPIADFGQSVGKLAAAAPTYAPIIPTGNGERMGVAGLGQFGQTLQSGIQNSQTSKGSKFAQGFLPGGVQSQVDLTDRSQQALNSLASNNSGSISTDNWDQFRTALSKGSNSDELSRNSEFVKLLKEMLERAGLESEAEKVTQGEATTIARGLGALDEYSHTKNQDVLGGRSGDGLLTAGNATTTRIDELLNSRTNPTSTSGSQGTTSQANTSTEQPENYTPPTGRINIVIDGTSKEVNRSEIVLNDNNGVRNAKLSAAVNAALQGIDKGSLVRGGYSEIDADAILRALVDTSSI